VSVTFVMFSTEPTVAIMCPPAVAEGPETESHGVVSEHHQAVRGKEIHHRIGSGSEWARTRRRPLRYCSCQNSPGYPLRRRKVQQLHHPLRPPSTGRRCSCVWRHGRQRGRGGSLRRPRHDSCGRRRWWQGRRCLSLHRCMGEKGTQGITMAAYAKQEQVPSARRGSTRSRPMLPSYYINFAVAAHGRGKQRSPMAVATDPCSPSAFSAERSLNSSIAPPVTRKRAADRLKSRRQGLPTAQAPRMTMARGPSMAISWESLRLQIARWTIV
jgi:hypothetical protein